MPTLAVIVVHGQPTRRSAYRYQFTPKHHGGDTNAAQWLPGLGLDEEFRVCNAADEHDLSDDAGRLYGVLTATEDVLHFIGTLNQQVAEFPVAREGEPWHGYLIYPPDELQHTRQ
jgi:hypothetical protein